MDVQATGKGHTHMICNVCFVLKAEAEFQINQTDARGNKTRRPSCQQCRLGIDRRDMSARQYREAKRQRPPVGSLWRCPICRKMGIVGVNVKVVIDHDHHAGRKRGFLCDSCNTGLGRFRMARTFCTTPSPISKNQNEADPRYAPVSLPRERGLKYRYALGRPCALSSPL